MSENIVDGNTVFNLIAFLVRVAYGSSVTTF